MTHILGISAFYHDSAAAIIRDGSIIAAAQEERFSRRKYDARFPAQAINYCLAEAGISPAQLDYVAYYEQPLTKFERLIETYVGYAPAGFESFRQALPLWLRQKLHLPKEIRRGLGGEFKNHIFFPSHHESHAASAFFASPYDEAAIITMDGVGEWATSTYGYGRGNQLELQQQINFPHSLGLLYSAFTYYCGFQVNSGEYKLMGLAPYGEPRFTETIYRHLIDLKPDGSYQLDLSYFDYPAGLKMTNRKFDELFGAPPRQPDSQLEQRHMDIAASIQKVCEEVVMRSARHTWAATGKPQNLVMAGGVALNCVANGRLLREGPFENIWIQPAAGDAGGSLGAALFVWHQLLDKPRHHHGADIQAASYLGPQSSPAEVGALLETVGARYERYANEDELLAQVATAMAAGHIVGWIQGRAEFGPRALGSRSIIGDARHPRLQATLNLKIKFRESFRPFAPCVLREHVHEWFAMRAGEDSPYMQIVAPVLEQHRLPLTDAETQLLRHDPDLSSRVNIARSSVPAITHVDYSARVQTVDERHGRFYRLIKKFHAQTNCPIIVNTSFNLSWEPIVLTPQDAYYTFMQSEMDMLVMEDCILRKAEQPLGMQCWTDETTETPRASVSGAASPWADPATGEPLIMTATCARNPASGVCYPVDEGLPRLFVADEGASAAAPQEAGRAEQFNNESPQPTYDELPNQRALLEKMRAGLFARLLNEQIPFDARVVEVGCGTGQLTNFLAIGHRTVLGVDACLNSLRLAQQFKVEQELARAAFAQMNLSRPALRENFFDFVISDGALHHAHDPRPAFRRMSRLAKPGGYVVVGLYNKFSRQLHHARRALFRLTGLGGGWLDPHLKRDASPAEREAWLESQYRRPLETTHSLDEVMQWMDEAELDFINSIPKPKLGASLTPDEQLFAAQDRGTYANRTLSQLGDLSNAYREGGFMIVIGRRRQTAA